MTVHAQALENAQHYHFSILASFVVGYLLSVWVQVDSIARPRNGVSVSRKVVIEQNESRLAIRLFVSLMFFLALWGNPAILPSILSLMGISLSENVIALLTIPMTIPVAGGWGVGTDYLLSHIPVLKTLFPPVEFTQTTETTTITATKQTIVSKTAVPEPKP